MKIKQLLSKKSRWCKRMFAQDQNGVAVSSGSPDAVSWCLLGAVNKCYEHGEAHSALRKLIQALPKGFDSLSQFNDTVTFNRLQTLLRKANV